MNIQKDTRESYDMGSVLSDIKAIIISKRAAAFVKNDNGLIVGFDSGKAYQISVKENLQTAKDMKNHSHDLQSKTDGSLENNSKKNPISENTQNTDLILADFVDIADILKDDYVVTYSDNKIVKLADKVSKQFSIFISTL